MSKVKKKLFNKWKNWQFYSTNHLSKNIKERSSKGRIFSSLAGEALFINDGEQETILKREIINTIIN